LPAQIELYATGGDAYRFLFIAKGGGSANKTYLYQETRAVLTPGSLTAFMKEKMKSLGTAACPPYHLAFVIGGTSAEFNLKTVKLATAKYLDDLPTRGSESGHAFRDLQLEDELPGAVNPAMRFVICSLKMNSFRYHENWELVLNSAENIFAWTPV
jgi:fumarate hydratase class I